MNTMQNHSFCSKRSLVLVTSQILGEVLWLTPAFGVSQSSGCERQAVTAAPEQTQGPALLATAAADAAAMDGDATGVPPDHPFLMGFSTIHHPFGGTPIYGNPQMGIEHQVYLQLGDFLTWNKTVRFWSKHGVVLEFL